MEVLETARVEVFAAQERIIEAQRRKQILCVVWEGTCVEKQASEKDLYVIPEKAIDVDADAPKEKSVVWHAGDWTGPIVLQPDKRLSGESDTSSTSDIVALSSQGVKVITIDFSNLHQILKTGSALYRKYLDRQAQQKRRLSSELQQRGSPKSQWLLSEALKNLNIVDLLDQNFALRKLAAVQKRHMESLAEGPIGFEPGERLWRDGAPVDKAFLVVSGTASFVPKRRNAGSTSASGDSLLADVEEEENSRSFSNSSNVSDKMTADALKVAEDFDSDNEGEGPDAQGQIQLETLFSRSRDGIVKSMTEANDFADLSKNLQKRAEMVTTGGYDVGDVKSSYDWEHSSNDTSKSDPSDRRSSFMRKESVRARFENKVLGTIHSREAYTGGLVFSRGHFLGDISRMFFGHVNTDLRTDQSGPAFDFSQESLHDRVIQESDSEDPKGHSSTLIAGKDGCVVLVFEKATLIPFLDEYPGLLLSLLGTQVVV